MHTPPDFSPNQPPKDLEQAPKIVFVERVEILCDQIYLHLSNGTVLGNLKEASVSPITVNSMPTVKVELIVGAPGKRGGDDADQEST